MFPLLKSKRDGTRPWEVEADRSKGQGLPWAFNSDPMTWEAEAGWFLGVPGLPAVYSVF